MEQRVTEREVYVVQAQWPSGKWRNVWPGGSFREQERAEDAITERLEKRAAAERLGIAMPERYRIEHQKMTIVHTVLKEVEA